MIEHVKFKRWDCDIIYGEYGNGRMVIQLFQTGVESPYLVATATVNLPDEKLDTDEIAIKDYSENEGMLTALVEAGIVTKIKRLVSSGYVIIPICTYTGIHANGIAP